MAARRSEQTISGAMTPPGTHGTTKHGVLGMSVTRLEDDPLVRGTARFAADVTFPSQLHMRVVRSRIAHGRLVRVDTTNAIASPDVVGVWTSADISDMAP